MLGGGPLPGRERRTWLAPAAIVLVAALASLLLLGSLSDSSLVGDEATYAAVAWDSLQSGSLFPQRLDKRLYFEKPPTTIWLVQLSFLVFGPTTFAARLPSAVAGLLLVLATLWLGRRWVGTGGGLLAALVLLTAPGPLVEHGVRRAVTDGWLMLAVFLAMDRVRRFLEDGARADLIAAGLFTVGGTWIKGFVAPALISVQVLVLTCALIAWPADSIQEKLAGWARRSWRLLGLALASGLVASLAWLVCLELSGAPRLLWKMLYRGVWLRATEGLHPSHLQPPGFYVERLIADFGLWLVPALVAVAGVGWRREGDEEDRLSQIWLSSWLAGCLLLFLPAVSRLGWYLYPAYPALAMLSAAGVLGILQRLRGRGRILLGALLVVGLVVRVISAFELIRRDVGTSAVEALATRARENPCAQLFIDPELRLLERGFSAEDYFYLRSADRTSWSLPLQLGSDPCDCLVTPRPAALISTCAREPCGVAMLRPRRMPAGDDLYVIDSCGTRAGDDPGRSSGLR